MTIAASKHYHQLVWAVRIFSVIAAALLLWSTHGYHIKQQDQMSFRLQDGWVLVSDQRETKTGISLPMKTTQQSPKIMDFYYTLPPKIYPVEALTLTVFQKSVWIYVDNRLLYQYEFLPTILHSNDPGDSKVTVTLPADSQGKELHIRYRRDNVADVSYIQPPEIVDGTMAKAPLHSSEIIIWAAMSAFLFTALLLVVKFFLQYRSRSRNYSDLALSFLFITTATWVLTYNKLINHIGINWVMAHTLEYLSFYAIPYALWSYISMSWNSHSKVGNFMRSAMGLFLSFAIGIKILFQVDFVALLSFFHMLFVINIILLMRELTRGFINKPFSYKLFAVGMWINIAASILALIQQYFLRGQIYLSVFFASGLVLGGVLQVLSVLCLGNEDMNMRFHTTFMQNLNNEYSRYETIFCNTGDVFIDWDSEHDTAYLSYNFEEYFGITRKHHDFTEFFRSSIRLLSISGDFTNAIKFLQDDSEHEHLECSFRHPQEGVKWFSLDLFSSLNSDGKKTHIIGLIKDITAQKQLQSEYAVQIQFNHISKQMYNNILEADMTQNLLLGENCKNLVALLELEGNYSYDDTIHAIQTKLTHPDYVDAYGQALSRMRILSLFENGITNFEHETYELDENNVYQWLHLNVRIYRSNISHTVCIVSYVKNITEEKEKEISLIEHSQRDSLSGFLNKEATRTTVERLLNSSDSNASHALFMIDIDHFKKVNDSVGHIAGDGVIANVAAQIKSCFREDDIEGRFGGDEFAILMCNTKDVSMVERKCLQLSRELDLFYQNGNKKSKITLSIGVALFPVHGNDYRSLCEKADRALYASKRRGRDTYTIYSLEHSDMS